MQWRWSAGLLSIVSLGLCGCGEEERPPSFQTAQQATPARPSEAEMVEAMDEHYNVVTRAHDALLHGDLEAFRSQLVLLGQQSLPPGSPEEWLSLYEALQLAASAGTDVEDVFAGGAALAPVVLACGTCHSELGEGPEFSVSVPDAGSNALETAMLGHRWATRRLWEGVTGPSDEAWKRGAYALAETDVFGDQGEAVLISEFVREREQQLRQMGEDAKAATGLEERALLYGRLLSTCAECHEAIRVLFDDPQ